ncbi:PH domain-containing protein [Patescibacteria group bacterium]|nr:PH domain-containing protein [Patescibacteria group bacterium]
MTRSKDLDAVAPDDPVINPSTPTPPPPSVDSNSADSTDPLRQKAYDLMGHAKHSLSALLVNPKVFNFEEKDHDEEILVVLRPHWFTNVRWLLITFFMLFAPLLIRVVPLLSFFPARYQFVMIIFWYILTFAFAFESFLSWYFDVFIITNERVIDIDFENLLNKKFSEAGLDKIQDTSTRVAGLAQTMFNFGDVLIQTAAEIPEITFEKVPNPEKIIKIIQELTEDKH